jgi:hypothetical protein
VVRQGTVGREIARPLSATGPPIRYVTVHLPFVYRLVAKLKTETEISNQSYSPTVEHQFYGEG